MSEFLDNENIFRESNKAWVSGIIEDEFEYSHDGLWEKFYKTRVRVTRYSGTEDSIPIIVSSFKITNLLDGSAKGKYAELCGQFRSYNKLGEDGRTHLELFLFVMSINVCEKKELEEVATTNWICLDGFICKPPVFRKTPLGRQITELTVAVDRTSNKSDYIPCIVWGKFAHYAKELEVGSRVKLCGRIQSRKYFKKLSKESETRESRIAYEVSVKKMTKVEGLRLKRNDSDK